MMGDVEMLLGTDAAGVDGKGLDLAADDGKLLPLPILADTTGTYDFFQ